ncbi:hypothetical protein AAVH_41824, partial [Aphelenchoides avenae]
KDFDAAVDQYGQLLKYSDVVSSVVAERTIDEIAAFALDPKATLMLCQATYNVKKPTTTWMARCIALLSDVQHTQRPELLAEALENAATLRKMISEAAHLDDATRQSHMLSIDAITAELRFRRHEFVAVHLMFDEKRREASWNPGAVAAIYETFVKVLLSPSCPLNLYRWDPHTLTAERLERAIELYPSTDTQAHIRCWRYLTVIQTLGGTSTSSKLAMPDTFKPEVDAVSRL